jgi:hypothetical protein
MNADERQLLKAYRVLGETRRASLLDYAEFLASRETGSDAAEVPSEPLDIPRPAVESVVKAIKRLRATYPMVDRSVILNDTSALMTQHLMQKRPAVEIIDELEVLFRRHYQTATGQN